jgi:cellulose biosynthesis protein BcsQ
VWSRSWQLDDDEDDDEEEDGRQQLTGQDGEKQESSVEVTITEGTNKIPSSLQSPPAVCGTNTLRYDHKERAVNGDADYGILDFHLTPMDPTSSTAQLCGAESLSTSDSYMTAETRMSNLADDLVRLVRSGDGRSPNTIPDAGQRDWAEVAAISQGLIAIEDTSSLARLVAERLLKSFRKDDLTAVCVVSSHIKEAVSASKLSYVANELSKEDSALKCEDAGARERMMMPYAQMMCQVIQLVASKLLK